jgi:aspartate ammonia-lyase
VGLRDVADRFGSAPTLARTCLQDGLEVEARLLFDGAASAVARRRAALARSVAPLDAVVLGATVVGTGAGASPAYRSAVIDHLARRTGRPIVAAPDPASRLQHGDDLVEVGAAVALAAQVASKVARDLRLLASGPAGGFGEVGLPAVMEGSAFFVGKVNPAVPESVVHAAIEVEGRQRAAWAAADQAELHLHPYDLAAGVAVLDAIAVLDRAAGHLVRHALAELVLHRDRSSELAAGACSTKVDP